MSLPGWVPGSVHAVSTCRRLVCGSLGPASLSESGSGSSRFGIGRVSASSSTVELAVAAGAGFGVVPGFLSRCSGTGTVAGPAGSSLVSGTMTWLVAVRSISQR